MNPEVLGLVARFAPSAGLVGSVLHGSAARPYADAASDLDLAIVVEDDVLRAMPADAVNQKHWDAGKKTADLTFWSRGEIEAWELDVDRWRAARATIVTDPEGKLAPLLAAAATLPDDVRADRMRLHYFEAICLAQKILAADKRGRADSAKLAAAPLVLAVAKVLFLARRSWPSPLPWTFDELRLADVPDEILSDLRAVLEAPNGRALRTLRGKLDSYLLAEGHPFVSDPSALLDWVYRDPRGIAARSRWGWTLQLG